MGHHRCAFVDIGTLRLRICRYWDITVASLLIGLHHLSLCRPAYQHRREDTEAQVDWDDPKELPGGRTQLPQIGDILDRRGRRRPRLRRRLPKGIWDADGNILPLQGDNRT